MDIKQLSAFVKTVSTLNFARTAAIENTSTANISRRLNMLEQELGVLLFTRNTRTLVATKAAETFYPKALAALRALEEGCDAISVDSQAPHGDVHINASLSFGTKILAPLIARFTALYPQIKVKLHLSDVQENIVEEGFDLSFRHNQQQDSSLVSRRLIDVRYLLVTSHSSSVADDNGCQSSNEMIRKEGGDWIFASLTYRGFENKICWQDKEAHYERKITPVFSTSCALALMGFLKMSDQKVCALLPDWLVAESLRDKSLRQLNNSSSFMPVGTESYISMVKAQQKFTPKRVQLFEGFIYSALN